MRLPVLLLSAVFALALTDVGFAQATLPNDDVNSANNPGSVRDDAPAKDGTPVREQALDCTCRTAPADAAAATKPETDAVPGDRTIDCSCHKTVPDTTGTLPDPGAAVTGSAGNGAVLPR